MSSHIQNYGFTKTLIQDNNNKIHNLVKWKGDYDGNVANIDVDINNNGNREFVSMQLNNNELRNLFGIQPVDVPLEKRLINDFLSHKSNKLYNPITLEGELIKRKTRRHRKKHYKRKKTRRTY